MNKTTSLYPILFLLLVWVTACSEGPYRGTYRARNPNYTHSGSNNTPLPRNLDPGKCHVRTVQPPVYETYTTYFQTYSAAEADEYPCNHREVMISPQINQWEYRIAPNCPSGDPNDCMILCYTSHEAKYQDIWEPVDSMQGTPQWVEISVTELIDEGGLVGWEEVDCEVVSYQNLGIEFEGKSTELSEEASAVIDEQLTSWLQDRPNIRVEISAHTDSRGR